MILLICIGIGIAGSVWATVLRAQRLSHKKLDYIQGAESWAWFWSAAGLSLGLIGLLCLYLCAVWNVEQMAACDEKVALYAVKAEHLEEKFRAELSQYTEIELEVFEKIRPENLSLYAVHYPNLRSSETLRDLSDRIGALYGEVYDARREKIDRAARHRFYRYWWRWI